jgi:hypothetical protein
MDDAHRDDQVDPADEPRDGSPEAGGHLAVTEQADNAEAVIDPEADPEDAAEHTAASAENLADHGRHRGGAAPDVDAGPQADG